MIRLKDVEMEYDNGTRAIKGITLTIEDGEFVFLVGPSGSGKSTIIKLLTGEVEPCAGRIMINGFSVSNISEKQIPLMRRTLGVIFQDFRLIEKKTVYDNLAFVMRAVGASPKEIRKRIPYVLELVGLGKKADSYPTELSGGEQQRVAIARALVNNHHRRRAHRKPGPGAVPGADEPAGEDQRAGHHRGGGDPREGPGGPLRQAGGHHRFRPCRQRQRGRLCGGAYPWLNVTISAIFSTRD